ncbi:hypothetical protein AVEN_137366-1, partial [Araneus ventricosus]
MGKKGVRRRERVFNDQGRCQGVLYLLNKINAVLGLGARRPLWRLGRFSFPDSTLSRPYTTLT